MRVRSLERMLRGRNVSQIGNLTPTMRTARPQGARTANAAPWPGRRLFM